MTELSLFGQPARFRGGLSDLGHEVFAWLQPNGALGESNAGLVVGDRESLLIDTLFDLPLTRRMLDAIVPVTPEAPIRRLVNTHADGDHCWGNQLVRGVEIISTRAGATDMLHQDPRGMRLLRGAGGVLARLPGKSASVPGGRWLAGFAAFSRGLSPYDFSGIELTPPTLTFNGTLELNVGRRRVALIEVGPAHTPGDLIVHVPDASVVFAADLMFVGVTPIMWSGTVENWIAGLNRIAALQPTAVVPGHGPVTDLAGVRAVRRYWEFVLPEVRARAQRGLNALDAAREIVRSSDFVVQEFSRWDGPERLVVSAGTIMRNDRGDVGRPTELERARLVSGVGQLGAELRGA